MTYCRGNNSGRESTYDCQAIEGVTRKATYGQSGKLGMEMGRRVGVGVGVGMRGGIGVREGVRVSVGEGMGI